VFDDNTEIEVSTINNFLNEAYDFEDTIGESDNYTDSYLYFKYADEKKLEPILLKLDVIRLSPYYKIHNDDISKSIYNYPYYLLSDGYYKFKEEFEKTYYNY